MRTHAVAGASMADSVRDYDGGYGVGSSSGSGPSTAARTPTVEELMADLTPEERLTVAMFQVSIGLLWVGFLQRCSSHAPASVSTA